MRKWIAIAAVTLIAALFVHWATGGSPGGQWEYKSYHGVTGQVLQLDELGAEGWELVAVCPKERDGQATFYLKRKK